MTPVSRHLIAAAALISATIGLSPAPTWADAAPGHAGYAVPAAQAMPTAQTGPDQHPAGGVDALIAHLHEKFKITPAQEDLWRKLADVMRENAQAMSTLAKKRHDSAKTMTAPDDLKSYAAISEAHTEGTKKMIPVFQALYDSMSEAQKKEADTEFKEHYAQRHHR